MKLIKLRGTKRKKRQSKIIKKLKTIVRIEKPKEKPGGIGRLR